MDMSTHTPDPAVVDLPLSDPKCVKALEDCKAFLDGENESQGKTPFDGQFRYGHWVTWFWIALLGVTFIVRLIQVLKDRGSKKKAPPATAGNEKPGMVKKVQALGRSIAYRRFARSPITNIIDLPSSLGTFLILFATLIFLLAITFYERPYYRPQFGFGSPPLAIRCGLMAFATIPILIAVAGKANLVTLLTGISHEKLNIYHRWIAWMSLGLSWIHTIPFFIASVNEPGDGGFARVKSEFYRNGAAAGMTEYSGVPPMAMLMGLCVCSLPGIRHKFYESFYLVHILLAITYLGTLFWHAGDSGDSWAYLWATLALWLASWFARAFWFTRPLNIKSNWLHGSPTTLTALPGDVTRVETWAPRGFKWTPSQHCFLRFVGIAPLDNHPFTIAAAPPAPGLENEGVDSEGRRKIFFLIRSHSGFTQRLAAYCAKQSDGHTASAWLDGPYGGLSRPLERNYDTLIIVSGGTGISASLPLLQNAVHIGASGGSRLKRVVLVWAIRSAECFTWIASELEDIVTWRERAAKAGVELIIKYHMTTSTRLAGTAGEKGSEETHSGDDEITHNGVNGKEMNVEEERAVEAKSHYPGIGEVVAGRPLARDVLAQYVLPGQKTVVFGCGPEGLRNDLAGAVAAGQSRVLKGEIAELALHLETFGW